MMLRQEGNEGAPPGLGGVVWYGVLWGGQRACRLPRGPEMPLWLGRQRPTVGSL